MKTIQPVSVWFNGQIKSATKFNLLIVYDNLSNSATFQWQLLEVIDDQDGSQYTSIVSQNNILMDGQDYQDWDGNNEYPYTWAAKKLNLTIVS